jgi:membrane protein
VPLLLFAFGLLGFLGLDEAWREDIAPDLRSSVSDPVFEVLDDTVTEVLDSKAVFWATAGAAIAVWELSAVVRSVMKVANSIYGSEERRPLPEQFVLSGLLAAAVLGLILFALVAVKFGPLLTDQLFGANIVVAVVSFLVRWALALGALVLTVGLLVRAGPDQKRPLFWVTYGAALAVAAWVVSSLLFGLYLTEVANYGSLFGNLATVFIALEYVYLSSLAFLTGLLVDSLTHARVDRV